MDHLKLPKISIVIVTLNNERTIEDCVLSIKMQDYPRKLIEYINVDGGSYDKTTSILRSYGYKIIRSSIKRNAEAQRGIGLKIATNDYIVSIDADNYLPDKNWLKKMVQPFIDDPSIVHAGTMHFSYRKSDSFYNRYCALFGATDPVAFYVGKPDRVPYYITKWTRGLVVKETSTYYIVEFDRETLPTVGCNGVVYKKSILIKFASSGTKEFMHIDVFADLVEKGLNKFAVVKNDIAHDTAVTLGSLMRKRIAFLSGYYLLNTTKRRYLIYDPHRIKDNVRLLLFIVYTVTFIKPFIDSLRGYMVIKDFAWFAHPAVCWVYLYSYTFNMVKSRVARQFT